MSKPLTRDNNKDYEHIKVSNEKLQEKGITGNPRKGNWTFSSSKLTREYTAKYKYPQQNNNTIIPGLRCPDCSSCAHKTDVPDVATCCTPIGWFFFYRRLDQDISSKSKLVIKNGEVALDTGQDKSESSF